MITTARSLPSPVQSAALRYGLHMRLHLLNQALLWSHPRERALYRKYRGRTMIPQHLFIDNLRVAALVRSVRGAIVECGTWRGGMIAALAEALPKREYLLFDSFEGLPPAQDIDGPWAREWQANPNAPNNHNNCTASEAEARQSMAMAGVEARFVKGWFADTLPSFAAEKPRIALLRLDGDWYESTLTCLRFLFPLVPSGGVVIIDDYGSFDGCTRAVHDYLSQVGSVEAIRRSLRGVPFIVRR